VCITAVGWYRLRRQVSIRRREEADGQRTRRSALAALLAALPVLLEPAALWLSSRIGLGGTGMFFFQWPYQRGAVAAEFAELAVGLLLTYGAAKVIARGRAPAALQ
jgi:hypothetical protein